MANVVPLGDCVFLDKGDVFFVDDNSEFQVDDRGWYVWTKSGEDYEEFPSGPYPSFQEALGILLA